MTKWFDRRCCELGSKRVPNFESDTSAVEHRSRERTRTLLRVKRNDTEDQPGACSHDGLDLIAFSGMQTATPFTTENKPIVFGFLPDSSKAGPDKMECVSSSSENLLLAIPNSTTGTSLTGKIGGFCGDFKTQTTQRTDGQAITITHYSNTPFMDVTPKYEELERCDSDTSIQAQFGYGDGLSTYNIPLTTSSIFSPSSRPIFAKGGRKNKKAPGKSSTGCSKKSLTSSFDFGTATLSANPFSPSTVLISPIAQSTQPLFSPPQSLNLFGQPIQSTFGNHDAQTKNGVATINRTSLSPFILASTTQQNSNGLFASPYITTITTTFGQPTQQSTLTSTFGSIPRSTVAITQVVCGINPQPIFTFAQNSNLSGTPLFGEPANSCNQENNKESVFVFGTSTPITSQTSTNLSQSVTQSSFSFVNTQPNSFGIHPFEPNKQKPNLPATELFRFNPGSSNLQHRRNVPKIVSKGNQDKTPNMFSGFNFNTPALHTLGTGFSPAQAPFGINQTSQNTFGTNQIIQTPFGTTQALQSFGTNQNLGTQQTFGANQPMQQTFGTIQTFGIDQLAPQLSINQPLGTNQISQSPFGMNKISQPFGTNEIQQQPFGSNQPLFGMKTSTPPLFGTNQIAPSLGTSQTTQAFGTNCVTFGINQLQPFGTNKPTPTFFGIHQSPQCGTGKPPQQSFGMGAPISQNFAPAVTSYSFENFVSKTPFGQSPTKSEASHFFNALSQSITMCKPVTCVKNAFSTSTAATLSPFCNLTQPTPNIFGQSTSAPLPNLFNAQQQQLNFGITSTQFCGQAQNSKNVLKSNTSMKTATNVISGSKSMLGLPRQQPLVWQPAPVMDAAQPVMQPTSFGFNPQPNFSQATPPILAPNSPLHEIDSILAFRARCESEFQHSLSFLSKTCPFHLISLNNETKHTASESTAIITTTTSTVIDAQIYFQPSKKVAAATPMIKKMRFFQLSEREIKFNDSFDDGRDSDVNFSLRKPNKLRSNKNYKSNTSRDRKVLFELNEDQPLRKPLPPPPRSSKTLSLKPLLLRKPSREEKGALCHLLLPKASVQIQCNRSCKSRGTQCQDGASSIGDYCGITLNRWGYYTIPPLKELAELKLEDGQILIKGFTIGRVGYGNVCFPDRFNVADLNLDKIVHFQFREVTIYPDESIKPPVGQGLNRRAQVTLDSVYPKGKDSSLPIKDVKTLKTMDFEKTLKKMCRKNGTKFIEYRPETGSWVFMVEHFSKYKYSVAATHKETQNLLKFFRKRQQIPLGKRAPVLDDIILEQKRREYFDETLHIKHCEKCYQEFLKSTAKPEPPRDTNKKVVILDRSIYGMIPPPVVWGKLYRRRYPDVGKPTTDVVEETKKNNKNAKKKKKKNEASKKQEEKKDENEASKVQEEKKEENEASKEEDEKEKKEENEASKEEDEKEKKDEATSSTASKVEVGEDTKMVPKKKPIGCKNSCSAASKASATTKNSRSVPSKVPAITKSSSSAPNKTQTVCRNSNLSTRKGPTPPRNTCSAPKKAQTASGTNNLSTTKSQVNPRSNCIATIRAQTTGKGSVVKKTLSSDRNNNVPTNRARSIGPFTMARNKNSYTAIYRARSAYRYGNKLTGLKSSTTINKDQDRTATNEEALKGGTTNTTA